MIIVVVVVFLLSGACKFEVKIYCYYEFFTLKISKNKQHSVELLLVDLYLNGRKLYFPQQTLVAQPFSRNSQ